MKYLGKPYTGKTEGMCSECHEYTDARDPCCNASVLVEGSYLYLIEDEEFDLTEETYKAANKFISEE